MLPFLEKRAQGGGVIEKKSGGGPGVEIAIETNPDGQDDKLTLASDILRGIDQKSPKQLCEALCAFMDAYEMSPHDEHEEGEGDENE